MAGLLLSIGGTVLVGLADHNSGTDTLAGDALCLFAAIMYVRLSSDMGGDGALDWAPIRRTRDRSTYPT